jgi:hypothetical protein
MSFRILALALAIVLLVTFATPAKAEAFDVMTGLAIAGAAIIVLVLIVYLVVANVEGPQAGRSEPAPGPLLAQEPEIVLVAVDIPRQGP